MKASQQMNSTAADLREVIEEIGQKFDPRLGKAAGAATAAIMAAGAHRDELHKAGKTLRRKVRDTLRYVREHPWETAALAIVGGVATMKAMEEHAGAGAGDAGEKHLRTRRKPSAGSRRATRH